ncbi:anti-sigma factor [Candidatus Woesearchaeota archaeon]|nr:anti-sigma factor [Candidatus Woesearchaeota archaeon]
MKLIVPVVIVLVLAIAVAGIHDVGWGGYAGEAAKLRRSEDPFSRQNYFGLNYSRSLVNFGMTGPNYKITNTGRRGAFSSVFNLDTNTFYAQGRNPGRISNFDPNVRGFAQLDVFAELLPFEAVELEVNDKPVGPRGSARIIGRGNEYGAGLNNQVTRSQVFIQAKNLPPPSMNYAYEIWLADEESGYSLSLGIMDVGAKFTGQFMMEMTRTLAGFDSIMITKENYPDVDPTPGEVVLLGSLGPTRDRLNMLGADATEWLR